MKVATGLLVLDDILSGGIEKNSKIMVYGNEDSGKTIACARFVDEGLKKEEACLFVTTDEDPKKVILKSKKLGLKLAEHFKKGLLTFLDARRTQKTKINEKIMSIVHEKDVTRTSIDCMNGVLNLKAKSENMKKYRELMKRSEELMATLSKSNTCMITLDPQRITTVELKMLEDFFQTAISLSNEEKKYYCTITKSEKKPEVQNQKFELVDDPTTYEVKKFFE
jgi:KaiC/GvpD/RAD55 family RecA-like ATPase